MSVISIIMLILMSIFIASSIYCLIVGTNQNKSTKELILEDEERMKYLDRWKNKKIKEK